MITALATHPLTTQVVATHRPWDDDGWFPWFPLIPLLFIGLWVFVITFVLRRRWRPMPLQTGEHVLAERFARGEIDEAEYRERRAVLRRKE